MDFQYLHYWAVVSKTGIQKQAKSMRWEGYTALMSLAEAVALIKKPLEIFKNSLTKLSMDANK